MQINTHIHHSDHTSDMEEEAGEMTLNSNIFVDARGATPNEKAAIQDILDLYYEAAPTEIYTIGR